MHKEIIMRFKTVWCLIVKERMNEKSRDHKQARSSISNT